MSTIELKERLINKINATENDYILEEVYRLLEFENDESRMYEFSNGEKNEIENYRLQIKNGQSLIGEEADKEIEEWL
jgi:hypothetical protein